VHIEAEAALLPKNAHWLEEFRRELMAFPASRHNDQVDAFSWPDGFFVPADEGLLVCTENLNPHIMVM
jgi:phage terminase large subunit-like protein